MATSELAPTAPAWSAAELRRLPLDQRDAALAAVAARAAADYHHDPALTAFEAFGLEDAPHAAGCSLDGPRVA